MCSSTPACRTPVRLSQRLSCCWVSRSGTHYCRREQRSKQGCSIYMYVYSSLSVSVTRAFDLTSTVAAPEGVAGNPVPSPHGVGFVILLGVMSRTDSVPATKPRVESVKVWHSVGRQKRHSSFLVHTVKGGRAATYLLLPLLHKCRIAILDTVLVDHLGGFSEWFFTSKKSNVRAQPSDRMGSGYSPAQGMRFAGDRGAGSSPQARSCICQATTISVPVASRVPTE